MIYRKIKNLLILFFILTASFSAISSNNLELKKYSNEIEEIKSILSTKYNIDVEG